MPKKSIEIDNSIYDSTGFATKIASISHQPPAGSANAQFDKTQFFLRHPVVFDRLPNMINFCTQDTASAGFIIPSRLKLTILFSVGFVALDIVSLAL